MSRKFIKTKKIVGEVTSYSTIEFDGGFISFDNQYKILREHLRLSGIGFGVPHSFFDLGEKLLDKWANALHSSTYCAGSIEDIKSILRDEFKCDPTSNNCRVRICISKLIEHQSIRSIDLFAGIGGIRMGFERAFGNKIDTVFVSEWDKPAQATYRANFHDQFEIAGDITQINERCIPPFDICLAGFPCQAFSMAGKHGGFQDNYKGRCRGTLFQDVVRICDYHKPKVIFCENVKGLTIHDHGNTFKVIKGAFEELGYKVFFKILNSKDFGVPQNRERIYLVCFRNDIAPDSFDFPVGSCNNVCIRDILDPAPVPSKYYLSDTYVETLKRHKERHEAAGNGFGYVIRSLDGIAGTIVCGGMGREGNLIIDNREHSMIPTTHIKGKINEDGIRKMTPREWARLQGFPEDFVLPLSDVHLYKQFGNSVTVNVIEAIANRIKEVLYATDRK